MKNNFAPLYTDFKNLLRFYHYKLSLVQNILFAYFYKRQNLALEIVSRRNNQNVWPRNILSTEETHVSLAGQWELFCHIWDSDYPYDYLHTAFHSFKVTVGYTLTAKFTLVHLFLRAQSHRQCFHLTPFLKKITILRESLYNKFCSFGFGISVIK